MVDLPRLFDELAVGLQCLPTRDSVVESSTVYR
jgi:hypothetical protein